MKYNLPEQTENEKHFFRLFDGVVLIGQGQLQHFILYFCYCPAGNVKHMHVLHRWVYREVETSHVLQTHCHRTSTNINTTGSSLFL